MRASAILAALLLVFAAPAANATTMAVTFTGSSGAAPAPGVLLNGVAPISGSFLYDSTLSLTNLGGGEWETTFTGNAILNGTMHSASFVVGIDSNITHCDSGASTCDFFFFDIYLNANDALGPESGADVNNDTLVVVDFELAAGTLTAGALPDFLIPNGSITAFVVEYATAGNASDDGSGEWTGPDFSTSATGSVTPVPEPATLLLLGGGLMGLAGFNRGRKRL